jgi:hypothetical protein
VTVLVKNNKINFSCIMVSLSSSSEYIGYCGEASGVLLESREFPSYFLWGYIKDLIFSIPIDTIKVLRKRVENAATTIRNNREMLERVEESFRRRLHYCIDNNSDLLITLITS